MIDRFVLSKLTLVRNRLFLLFLIAAACGQDDDPNHAKEVFAKINEGAGFRSWARAPGFPKRTPSFTAHSDAVEIFVNTNVTATLAGGAPKREWPVGSIIVKEGFAGMDEDTRNLVAVMEKRADGWFWAEYNGDGDTLFSGKPAVCVDCHDNRKDYSDWVYAFELPR